LLALGGPYKWNVSYLLFPRIGGEGFPLCMVIKQLGEGGEVGYKSVVEIGKA
jgi:hypothetical protein